MAPKHGNSILEVQSRIDNERNKPSECRALADLMLDTASDIGSVAQALHSIQIGKTEGSAVSEELSQNERNEAAYKAQSGIICKKREATRTKLDAFKRGNKPGRFYSSTIENYKRLLKLIDCVNDMTLHGDTGDIQKTLGQLLTAAQELDYMAEAFSQNTTTLNSLHQKSSNQSQGTQKEREKELAKIKKDVRTIQKEPPGGDRTRTSEKKLKTVFNPTYDLWEKKYKPKTGFKRFLSKRKGKVRKLDDTFSELG